jgi:GGDEF domain-containing protein
MTGGDPRSPDERLASAAHAAHDLSDALWHSLHEEISGPRRERAAELAQRLADVCAAIALLAAPDTHAAPATLAAPATHAAPTTSAYPPPAPAPQSPLEPPEPAREGGIEVHDARSSELRPVHAPEGHSPVRAGSGEEGPSAWIGSIGRRLERYREDRLPFAVLLIEVLDIDRLVHAESQQEVTRLTTLIERAIGSELRPADLLTHEALGRYWLVTPETDTVGARQLAERLARTVRLAAGHRGVPLEVAIGIAVCPDDGRDASALAAHADVGVYAARASGRSIAPDSDPAA